MSTTSSRSSSMGSYFFCIENLPKKYTWQDLKDLIRREASHGIWTDMAIYPNGQTGGKGHARVQRRDEAANLYRYLTENVVDGRRLRVHLWDISGQEADFLKCNCESSPRTTSQGHSAQAVEVTRMSMATGWQIVTPVSPMAASQASYPVTPAVQYPSPAPPVSRSAPAPTLASQAALLHQMASLQLSPQDPRYAVYCQQYQLYQAMRAQQAANQQAGSQPSYAVSSLGIPINTSRSTVRTESRGIFVSGLNYKAHAKDVKELFSRAGNVTKCEIQKDAATGKSKGNATILYNSAAEAQRAITMLHGKTYMNMRLNIRLDKEATAVSPPPAAQASRTTEPIIVNGSQTGRRAQVG